MTAERDYRIELRLKDSTAGTLKILRKHFPEVPLSEMKARIIGQTPVYSCSGAIDGRRLLMKLKRELKQAGAAAELQEVWTGADGVRRTSPLSWEYLSNSLHRYREISRQTDRDIDSEADE